MLKNLHFIKEKVLIPVLFILVIALIIIFVSFSSRTNEKNAEYINQIDIYEKQLEDSSIQIDNLKAEMENHLKSDDIKLKEEEERERKKREKEKREKEKQEKEEREKEEREKEEQENKRADVKIKIPPLSCYIERKQITFEDTKESIAVIMYYEKPVFWEEINSEERSEEKSEELIKINSFLEKEYNSFFEEYKEHFLEGCREKISVNAGYWGLENLVKNESGFYCTMDISKIYCNDKGYLSIRFFSDWMAGGVRDYRPHPMNFNLNTGERLTLSEALGLSKEDAKELVVSKTEQHIEKYFTEYPEGMITIDAVKVINVDDYRFYIWEDKIYVCYEKSYGAAAPQEVQIN